MKYRVKLNPNFLRKQNIDEAGEKVILELHELRLNIDDKMKSEDDPVKLKILDKEYTEIEFKLQDAWGFPRNAHYHRFWNRPKCTCPKMDNEDAYSTKYSIINHSCPLHGK